MTRPRFQDYREVVADENWAHPATCRPGHAIQVGDRIGIARGLHIQCADCWHRWKVENAEAALSER